MQGAGCGVRGAEGRVLGAEGRVQGAEGRMLRAGCWVLLILNTGYHKKLIIF